MGAVPVARDTPTNQKPGHTTALALLSCPTMPVALVTVVQAPSRISTAKDAPGAVELTVA